MFEVFVSIVAATLVLMLAEGLLRQRKWKGTPEFSRKLVHVAHGLAAATWPFFISYQAIIAIELGFLILVILARKLHIFRSITDISRHSWGEVFFPLGIISVALIQPSKWVFAIAVLTLALADAAAALVGKNYGTHEYRFFGQKKTLEGSFAFVVVTALVLACVIFIAPSGLTSSWTVLLWLPFAAAALEGVTPFGLDNLLIPILLVVVLNGL